MKVQRPTREQDDAAIAWLCERLDGGNHPGTASPLTREPWSEILKRRIKGKYEREKRTPRNVWLTRHFHVRQLAARKETELQSAKYVAQIWSVKAETLKDAATRKPACDEARGWIADWLEEQNRRFPFANAPEPPQSDAVYKSLDRAIERIAKEFSQERKIKGATAV